LKTLEDASVKTDESKAGDEDAPKEWKTPSAINWLRMQPVLGDVDLRDYFWLARDRTSSTLSGVTMVSPHVRKVFEQLVGDNEGDQIIAAKGAAHLDAKSQQSLLDLLGQQVRRQPDQVAGSRALLLLAEHKIPNSAQTLLEAVQSANPSLLEPSIAFKIKTLSKQDPTLDGMAQAALEYLAKQSGTRVANAAVKALGS